MLWCSEHPQYEYTESNRVVMGGLSGTTAGPAGIYVYNRRRMGRSNRKTKIRTSGTVSPSNSEKEILQELRSENLVIATSVYLRAPNLRW